MNYFTCREKLPNGALICVTGVMSPRPPTQFIQPDYFDSILGMWLLNYYNYCASGKSRDSAVGIATSYGLDDRGGSEFESRWGQEFSYLNVVETVSGAYPDSYTRGTGLFPLGVKRPGCELTIHLQLAPRSRKCGSIHILPHTPSWHSA
jgi:hypothetical protein